jgi:predicted ATP-grasp superfamily ATP-dependent carboligase
METLIPYNNRLITGPTVNLENSKMPKIQKKIINQKNNRVMKTKSINQSKWMSKPEIPKI